MDRSEALSKLADQLGGKLVSLNYAFGDYDGVFISEAPDDVTAAAAILTEVSPCHVKATKTTRLLTVEEAMEAMRKAGASPTARRDRAHRARRDIACAVAGRGCHSER